MPNKSSEISSAVLLDRLAKRGSSVCFPTGEVVFHEGDPSDVIYVLLEGQLKVFSKDKLGREVVYNILEAGELVGELLLDGGPRSASVKATTDVRCAVIDQSMFESMLATDPGYGRLVIEHLIARLRKATLKIRSLAFDGVYERVVALLNELATESKNGLSLPSTLTQQEVANRIGASREMVNYVMRDLIKGGFLSRRGRSGLQIVKALPVRW